MKRKSVVRTHLVNKHFHEPVDFHVLKDVSFDVKQGEFVSIMGKSGSGKSTLLYILSTMDTDYTGELYLNDRLVSGLPADELSAIRNEHIGFVFQFHYLLSEFSVLDNISLPALKLARKHPEEIRTDVLELLKLLDIAHLAEKQAARISGGEKQRVAIARALATKPKILLMDEPFGALDIQTKETMQQFLLELWLKAGCTI
ncbi:MAG: ABC transporter ATP-binding protein, partial [Bacteroidota bacterium]